jgi:hypothetical protein
MRDVNPLLGLGLYSGFINKGDRQMINRFTGIRIASTFSSKNAPLEIGQRPTEWTRKHGLPDTKSAGQTLVNAYRAKLAAK